MNERNEPMSVTAEMAIQCMRGVLSSRMTWAHEGLFALPEGLGDPPDGPPSEGPPKTPAEPPRKRPVDLPRKHPVEQPRK